MRKVVAILAAAFVAIAAPALAQQKAAGAERAMTQAVAWQRPAALVELAPRRSFYAQTAMPRM